jgi:uncharacterized protein
VAGEALMHRVFTGRKLPGHDSQTESRADSRPQYDMGGDDFGVSDASSWDDGGGGSSDWN